MKAKLILENGMIFEGIAFGYLEESVGEVVFNTGMTGYQEVFNRSILLWANSNNDLSSYRQLRIKFRGCRIKIAKGKRVYS